MFRKFHVEYVIVCTLTDPVTFSTFPVVISIKPLIYTPTFCINLVQRGKHSAACTPFSQSNAWSRFSSHNFPSTCVCMSVIPRGPNWLNLLIHEYLIGFATELPGKPTQHWTPRKNDVCMQSTEWWCSREGTTTKRKSHKSSGIVVGMMQNFTLESSKKKKKLEIHDASNEATFAVEILFVRDNHVLATGTVILIVSDFAINSYVNPVQLRAVRCETDSWRFPG